MRLFRLDEDGELHPLRRVSSRVFLSSSWENDIVSVGGELLGEATIVTHPAQDGPTRAQRLKVVEAHRQAMEAETGASMAAVVYAPSLNGEEDSTKPNKLSTVVCFGLIKVRKTSFTTRPRK